MFRRAVSTFILHVLYGKLVRIKNNSENSFHMTQSVWQAGGNTAKLDVLLISRLESHFSIEPLGNQILLLNVPRGTTRADIRQSILR